METILTEVAKFLHGYANSIEKAVSEQNYFEMIQVALALLALPIMAYTTVRALWRRLSQHDEKLHEQVRTAERTLEKKEDELKAVRARNDELLAYDPERFQAEMDRIDREGRLAERQSLPDDWLAPLRPAIGLAHATLAREWLLQAGDHEMLDQARLGAWGAIAADPDEAEYRELLAEIDEAGEMLDAQTLTEAELLALRLPRVEHRYAPLMKAGHAMFARGKYKVARVFFSRAHELAEMTDGLRAESTLAARHWQATAIGFQGQYARAEAMLRDVLEILRRADVLGEEHPNTLATRHAIARQMSSQGRYADAEAEFRDVLEIQRRPDVLGEENPKHTLASRHEIARQMSSQGRYADAEDELREILKILRRPDVLGEEHPRTLTTRHEIARQMASQGRYADAEAEFREILEIQRRPDVLGEEHPDTLNTRAEIASQMASQGRTADAEAEFRDVLEILRRPDVLGEEHPNTLTTRHEIARQMASQGRYADAEAEFRDVLEIKRRPDVLGEEHPSTLNTRAEIASQMASQGRTADAEAEFRDVLEIMRRPDVLGEEHPSTLVTQFRLAQALDGQGKASEADTLLDGLRDRMLAHVPEGHTWITALDAHLAARAGQG